MYVKVLGILLLLVGSFFFGRMTGVDSVKAEQTAKVEKVVENRAEAEKAIIQERVVYRDRIQKIREVTTNNCKLPDDLVGLLRESGVFSH
jgi:hypothetical protein